MSLIDAATLYATETALTPHAGQTLEVLLRRAYMAGALESVRHDRNDVLRDCLDFARTIGTSVERSSR